VFYDLPEALLHCLDFSKEHINVLEQRHDPMFNYLKIAYVPMPDALCVERGFGDVTAGPPASTEITNRVSTSNP